jgi:outer membrane protein assembly factor BamB
VLASGTVYVGSSDGYLYALGKDHGLLRWKYKTDGSIYTSPAVKDGQIYFNSANGSLYAVQ